MSHAPSRDAAVRVPVFPTHLHAKAANVVREYFASIPEVDTVLVVNSCARGQAVPDSDLDFAILVGPKTTRKAILQMAEDWKGFSGQNRTLTEYRDSSEFAHLHLDVIKGEYEPTVLEVGVASDYFEIEIGNQIAYSTPMGPSGASFAELRKRWLPYYDENLRSERFVMMKSGCQYDLNHIPRFVARGLYFQALDILGKAFQEYLQVLFIARGVYPIAYNKWIRYQLESLLSDPGLYAKLPPILSVCDIESEELNGKAEMLQDLLDQVELTSIPSE